MVYKMGRYGKFLACPISRMPQHKKYCCKVWGKMPEMRRRGACQKSKRGKVYYGCEHNPTCDFMLWDKPVNQKCEKCGSIMVEK